ncbi:ABC-2 type transport system ATP-binding protein [Jatrophihabitans endophyticus]|uniref:ABC-2 type transport system ATP-binding protein n=1 Tax=Jatrophihabitans endophyticus TaxID=1206085 RepID=A0A1M5KV74_9ACTN|nr:CocE/NonD family hydrolase [Jatrophihabitans endophyticus]SHG56635.1 ABC-2 type transport system ATP-binding protein [Jatrophihabitans endophyticus]
MPVARRRNRVRSLPLVGLLTTVVATGAAVAVTADPAGAAAGYTVTSLHFAVGVGPGRAQRCDVVGDLYLPSAASATKRVPAILTTNGFGGSAADQAPFAEQYARTGYAVLSYSGLGFGGSGCKITLDDPAYDGMAASQLVSYLGGAAGIAYTDAAHTTPAPRLTAVVHDAKDHSGKARRYDPRVGMWGGSYGGQIQFAAASVDARIDALNPQITWNDLSYSLGPNNVRPAESVTTAAPGATKLTWGVLFSTVGVLDGAQYAKDDPGRLVGCPNFADFVCPALVTAGTTGYFRPDDVAALRHASVASYVKRIRVPVLLDQGQTDTLFNLGEAVATYTALRRQGTPVSMLWREQGHSGGTPSAAGAAYEDARIRAWFDHYLAGKGGTTGSRFAYYRDWTGTFAEAAAYPVGATRTYYLSGDHVLQSTRSAVTAGAQRFVTTAAGAPTGLADPDALGGRLPAGTPIDLPDEDLPGTTASWQTAALARPADVVGSPTVTVRVAAPTAAATSAAGPAGQLVLFPKLYDVAPDGTAALIKNLVAPVRIADPTQRQRVTLPAIAHRFAAGHRIRLVIAGGDVNYRGGLAAHAVTITGSTADTLALPVVGRRDG